MKKQYVRFSAIDGQVDNGETTVEADLLLTDLSSEGYTLAFFDTCYDPNEMWVMETYVMERTVDE